MDNRNDEFLKYAAFGLMGLYAYKKTKQTGFGNHYLQIKTKTESFIDRISESLPVEEKYKSIAKTTLKGVAESVINEHIGVRNVK